MIDAIRALASEHSKSSQKKLLSIRAWILLTGPGTVKGFVTRDTACHAQITARTPAISGMK
jgi:hypothetical protein